MNISRFINYPKLKVDEARKEKYNRDVGVDGATERAIVFNLFNRLEAKGFTVLSVDDGEEEESVGDAIEAMELIFNLDDCRVNFSNKDQGRHWIFLVCGNGNEIISDWSYYIDDRDGFKKSIEEFLDD